MSWFQFTSCATIETKNGKCSEYIIPSIFCAREVIRIFKKFQYFSGPEYTFSGVLIQGTKFLGHLFFLTISPVGETHVHDMRCPQCTWRAQCDTHNTHNVMPTTHDVTPMMHMTCTMWCWKHMQCAWCDAGDGHDVMQCDAGDAGIMSCMLRVSHCAPHASHQRGRRSGKISTLEIFVPQKNKHPGKCNLFWARKVLKFLNILITSLAQNMLGIVYKFWTFQF